MKDKAKYIIIGIVIAVIFYYLIIKKDKAKIELTENDFNLQDNSNSLEFILNGEQADEIMYLKSFYNYFIAEEFIKENNIYDNDLKLLNDGFFKGTDIYNLETGALEKQFCVDLNKMLSNIFNFDFKESNSTATLDIIKKGDKSKQIEKLQSILSIFLQKQYKNNGAYDADTYNDVIKIFEGTSILVDNKLGAISNKKLNNLSIFIFNLLNLTK